MFAREGGEVSFEVTEKEVLIHIKRDVIDAQATISSDDFHVLCQAETIGD